MDAAYVDHMGTTGSTDAHALVVRNGATAGKGQALLLRSDNPSAPAASIQGTGQLLSLKNSSGVEQFAVAQDGSFTSAGFTLPILGSTSRKPAWRPASYAQLFQTGHGFSATGGVASSNLNDTTTGNFIRGTQAATITTNATGAQANIRKTAVTSALDLTGKMIRLTFKVDDVTHLNKMYFYLGSSAFSNYFLWVVHTHSASADNYVQSGEWVIVDLQWADVNAASGSYSISATHVPSTRTGFTDFQLAVFDDAAGAVTAHLQSVEIIPDTTTTFPTGVISITFDDSYQSVYDLARPKMDTYGYRGTIYHIADVIGTNPYLSMPELRSLANFSGWEMAAHAFTSAAHNAGYNTLTAAQVNAEMRNLRSWLYTNGFNSENFAYPKGHFSSTTDGVPIDQIASQYWATSRSIISENIEVFSPPMLQRLRAKTGISSAGTSVSSITAAGGLLDRCQLNGSWLNLCLHQITTGTVTDSTQISQTDFNTLMDGINSRGIPVLPVSDVMRLYS
jgi:hypothetical protein